MAETSGLLNRHRGLNLYHGFESRPLRQHLRRLPIGHRLNTPPRAGDQQEIAERVEGVESAGEIRGRLRERADGERERRHRDQEDDALPEEPAAGGGPPPSRNRGQMAVFLTKTFDLQLYGP